MIRHERSPNAPGLLPLVSVLTVAFFVLPLLRLLVFRAAGVALPISLLSAPYLLVALVLASLRAGTWRIRQFALLLVGLLIPPALAYLVSAQGASLGAMLGSLWIYLVGPIVLLALGSTLSMAPMPSAPQETQLRVRRRLLLSTLCLLAGILVNALDAALLGDEFYVVYKDYASAVPSLFAGVSLPRLSGAYFSGLDLTFAAILLLTLMREVDKRLLTLTSVALFVAIALTFTRNSYVILAAWLLARQLSPRKLSRAGGLAFLLMPVASILIALLLAAQVSTGELEANAETSSVLTRLASWTFISGELLSSGIRAVLGLGITQNALMPGESDIYAIDNFFWELMCYGGAVAFLAFGLMFWLIRRKAMCQLHGLGHIALVISAILPIAGVFNNMAGNMLAQTLFLCCGLLGAMDAGRAARSHATPISLGVSPPTGRPLVTPRT